MDRYYMPVSREEDDSIDHQYKVYDYSTNDYQRSTKAMPSKMKTKYWLSKQQIKQKLGKEQDEWVVKGDNSLDAKLSYFHHVNHSCDELLRLCDRIQHHMKGLSIQEMLLGKYMDARSKYEGTEAGKMMSYIGYAEEYMSKKRGLLYPSVTRLMKDLGVFQQKAVQDCSYTVERMEQFRTEFRASLLWLDDISQQLNPEDREQLEKFRKVQSLTREKRVEFARMKDNTIQKIEILAASRINLLSARLEEYHLATQKYFQSSINALQEVVSAKERLDSKIEEKRIADLEAEIDAHLPSKHHSKLFSTPSQEADKENVDNKGGNDVPMTLKDHAAANCAEDCDLLNLHDDDFGNFEAAKHQTQPPTNNLFEQETLDDIFGRLSPAPSITDLESNSMLSPDLVENGSADQSTLVGGLDSATGGVVDDSGLNNNEEGLNTTNSWLQDFSSQDGDGESLDWNMMNDLLSQSNDSNLAAPASAQDLMILNMALTNLDTGLNKEVPTQETGEFIPPTDNNQTTENKQTDNKQTTSNKQMQPQQFNAWLNLFSDLDPIAQNKMSNSGNVA